MKDTTMTAHFELWDTDTAELIATLKTQDLLLTAFLDVIRTKDFAYIKGYYVTTDNVRTYLFSGDDLEQWFDDYEVARHALQVNYQLSDVGLRDYLEQNGFSVTIEEVTEFGSIFDLHHYFCTIKDSQGREGDETGATRSEAVLRAYLSYAFHYDSRGYERLLEELRVARREAHANGTNKSN